MPKPNNRGRTRRSGLLVVGICALVLVGAAATFVAVKGWDAVSSVFAGNKKHDPNDGKIAVVVSPVPLPAFTAIDPAVFIDPRTGDFRVARVTAKVAEEAGLVRDPGQLRGRVLKRDKSAGLTFSEADFYPRGTLPSPTAAIEPGYRGVRLSAKSIDGLAGLKRFDRCDLVAVIDVRGNGSRHDGDVIYSPEAAAASDSAREWKTERRIVAENAKIIEPAPAKAGPGGMAECFVAIRDDEAAPLADAIAKGAKIVAMARSGLPGGDMSPFVDANDTAPMDSIHVISGKSSWRQIVPGDKYGNGQNGNGHAGDEDANEPRK